MSDDSEKLLWSMISDRLDRMETTIENKYNKTDERLRAVEMKVNWAFGIATFVGAVLTTLGQKIWGVIAG
jgi:tetrahydromethanopterin S-methyltransferase subunit G